MAQMYLKDLAEKTRRGQLGRALKGRIPGGRAYGYDVLPAGPDGAGERRINSAEATVVQRIFTLFAAGTSPRAIAKQLNAEGVPGPDGRDWRDTTIRGQLDRGTGLLNNALYAGRLEWNRCSYVKDPRTGKRVARPNPRTQWEIVPVPELRIIDDALWDAVKARQADEQRLATAPELPKVRLHPNLAGLYREKVAALAQALADPSIKVEAAEDMLSQIERITLDGSLAVVLQGDLARILQFCEMGDRKQQRPRTDVPGRGLSVVAGARNHLNLLFQAPSLQRGSLRAARTAM
jgi:hypothetical protein